MDLSRGSDRMLTPYIVWRSPTGTIHGSTVSTAQSENKTISTRSTSVERVRCLPHRLVAAFTIMGMPSISRSALQRLKLGWALCGKVGAGGGGAGSTMFRTSTPGRRYRDY